MIVYAIFKEAVYRHECGGIFSTLPAAEDAARRIVENEDGHHEVVVHSFLLDAPCPIESGSVLEQPALLKFSKHKHPRPGQDNPVIREEL